MQVALLRKSETSRAGHAGEQGEEPAQKQSATAASSPKIAMGTRKAKVKAKGNAAGKAAGKAACKAKAKARATGQAKGQAKPKAFAQKAEAQECAGADLRSKKLCISVVQAFGGRGRKRRRGGEKTGVGLVAQRAPLHGDRMRPLNPELVRPVR